MLVVPNSQCPQFFLSLYVISTTAVLFCFQIPPSFKMVEPQEQSSQSKKKPPVDIEAKTAAAKELAESLIEKLNSMLPAVKEHLEAWWAMKNDGSGDDKERKHQLKELAKLGKSFYKEVDKRNQLFNDKYYQDERLVYCTTEMKSSMEEVTLIPPGSDELVTIKRFNSIQDMWGQINNLYLYSYF